MQYKKEHSSLKISWPYTKSFDCILNIDACHSYPNSHKPRPNSHVSVSLLQPVLFFLCQVQKLCTNYKYYYWIWVVLNIDGYSLLVSSLIPYIKKLQLVLNQTDTFPMSLRKRPIHRSQIHSHARSKSRVLMHNIPITRYKICRVTNLKSPYAFLYFI